MPVTGNKISFTGEFFVPGESTERLEADHLERYVFAAAYASGKCVLDIACGVGYAATIFLDADAALYKGVDLGPEQIRYATQNYGSNKSEFEVGDIRTFSDGNRYDLITCFETIEHVSDYKLAIKNLVNLLTDGGSLFISSPNRPITSPNARHLHDKPVNKFHTQEFTPKELVKELTSAGLTVKSTNIYGQRLRYIFPSWKLNKFRERIFGNPDENTSPRPTRFRGRVPRYFLVIATKKTYA